MKRLSLRGKIILLLVSALAISLASYSYVGSNLIWSDKISYIYDYNLSHARLVASRARSWIDSTISESKLMGLTLSSPSLAKETFDRLKQDSGIAGIGFFRLDRTPVASFGLTQEELGSVIDAFGWKNLVNQGKVSHQGMLTGSLQNGLTYFAASTVLSNGTPAIFTTVAKMPASVVPQDSFIQIGLFNDSAQPLFQFAQKPTHAEIPVQTITELLKSTSTSAVSTGVRELKLGKTPYIVGYENIPGAKVLVTAMVSRDKAFETVKVLLTRTLALDVSILLFSIGVGLSFANGITRKLRLLWQLTLSVAEGDFSVRVPVSEGTKDEVNSLGISFNLMADKINELMIQTAEKARMEKELETAQVVQSRFFPRGNFTHPNLELSGAVKAASECGGDWWYYTPIDDKVIITIGDVTGHGVSAALVTAATHGSFSLLMKELGKGSDHLSSTQIASMVLDTLNTVVRSAAGGEATMTFIVAVLDTKTGTMHFANASHRTPYVLREGKLKPLMEGKTTALGQEETIECTIASFDFLPDDLLFLYTDGVLECSNPAGEMISKSQILTQLKALHEANQSDAGKICSQFIDNTMQFFGENSKHLEDDVTVIFASIPKHANFATKKIAA